MQTPQDGFIQLLSVLCPSKETTILLLELDYPGNNYECTHSNQEEQTFQAEWPRPGLLHECNDCFVVRFLPDS